ncbi:MAG: sodium:solute symporter family transporter [Thermoleophilia bacterium]
MTARPTRTVVVLVVVGWAPASFGFVDAGPGERMLVARMATAALGLVIMVVALRPPGFLAEVVGGAFARAADTVFPVMVLGIWWRRATREGAVAGLATGLALWSFSAWGGWYGGKEWIEKWLPVEGHSLLVAPVLFVVVAAVSLVTQPTSGVGPFLDRIHGGRFGARP